MIWKDQIRKVRSRKNEEVFESVTFSVDENHD